MIRIIVAGLTILGAALTIAGLLWGANRLRAEHRALVTDLDELDRIARDPSIADDEQNRRRQAIRPVTSTFGDLEYFREWVRRSILDQAVSNLGPPAIMTGTGVVLSTVASVWSLWL